MTMPLIIGLIAIAAIVFIGFRYRMLKQMVVMLVLVVLVLAVIGWSKYQGFKQFAAMKEGMAHTKQTISTTKATLEEWHPHMEAVGSLRAAKGVDISNELAGTVEKIHFASGSDVKMGALLLKLRAEDDVAKLTSLEATAKLADITYNRDKKQLAVQAVSQATVDTDYANLLSARAQVAQQKALVEKKRIRAPFAGRLGIRNVDLGQYLNAGTAIVTLQQLNPIYLDFTLPQQALSQVKAGQSLAVKNDAFPDRSFTGKISAVNPKVDPATRNVQVRAELPNADRTLLPGMYATASIAVGEAQSFVTLPQTAITYNPYGNTVFIVQEKSEGKDGKDKKDAKPKPDEKAQPNLVVEQRFVTTGETRGDQVQILKGVKEGETVVSSGQLKLQNGMGVTVNNEVTPKNDVNPMPQDQ